MTSLPQGLGAQLWKVRAPGWVGESRAAYGQGEHNLGAAFLPALSWPFIATWLGIGTATVAAGATVISARKMLELRRAYAGLNEMLSALWRKTQARYGVQSVEAQTVETTLGHLQRLKNEVDGTKTMFGAEGDYELEYERFHARFKELCAQLMTGIDAAVVCESRPDVPRAAPTRSGMLPGSNIEWKNLLWGAVGVVALGGTFYIAGQMIGAGMKGR